MNRMFLLLFSMPVFGKHEFRAPATVPGMVCGSIARSIIDQNTTTKRIRNAAVTLRLTDNTYTFVHRYPDGRFFVDDCIFKDED